MAPPSPLLHLPDPTSEDPNSEDPNSEDSPTTDQTHNAQLVRSHFYTSLKLLLSTYWVLVVVGAFLLVILTGQPSLLKTVYLIFFFVFLIIYQVCSMLEPPEVTQETTQPKYFMLMLAMWPANGNGMLRHAEQKKLCQMKNPVNIRHAAMHMPNTGHIAVCHWPPT